MFKNQFINLLWETTETHSSLCGQHILPHGQAYMGSLITYRRLLSERGFDKSDV